MCERARRDFGHSPSRGWIVFEHLAETRRIGRSSSQVGVPSSKADWNRNHHIVPSSCTVARPAPVELALFVRDCRDTPVPKTYFRSAEPASIEPRVNFSKLGDGESNKQQGSAWPLFVRRFHTRFRAPQNWFSDYEGNICSCFYICIVLFC